MNSSGWNNSSQQNSGMNINSSNQRYGIFSNSTNQTSNNWNNLSSGLVVQSNEARLKDLEKKYNNLEKKIESISQNISKKKYSEIIHTGIVCNNCQKNNISGIRYLCGNCGNYNLCNTCIKYAEEIHPNNHFLIRIPDTRIWNQINGIPNPNLSHYNI